MKFKAVSIALVVLIILTLIIDIQIFIVISIWIILYLIIVSVGVFNVQWQFFMPIICTSEQDAIILTFDDGPHPVFTPQILAILKEFNIKATFFVIGRLAKQYPDILQSIINQGHVIGNHTYQHSHRFGFYSTYAVKDDILACNAAVRGITGRQMQLFRPPVGVTNPNIAKAVTHLNLKTIGWDVRSLDTRITSQERLFKRIKSKITNGSIVLLHDRQKITVEILPKLLTYFNENGIKVANIEEGLTLNAYA